MNRVIFIAWFLPLIFMAIAFYVLLESEAPLAAKIVFTALPISIWISGGFAIYREYHEQEKESRKEEDILEEARRILSTRNHHEERRD
jgi:positive regulator of sigma E activity